MCIAGGQRHDEADVDYFENYDIHNIETPIDTTVYGKLLRESGFNSQKANFLLEGFTSGFSIGYNGPRKRVSEAQNLPITVGSKVELWNKIMKEVKLKCYAGPFNKPPFRHYIQSTGDWYQKTMGDKLD